MMVIFTSQSEKKAHLTVRRILDSFANRIGDNTWQTVITKEGLDTVNTLLRRSATKNTAVACHWIRARNRSELLWIVGNRSQFNEEGIVPVNRTQKQILHEEWENDWRYLPLIKGLSGLAAILHDWGKASDFFQKKLKNGTTKMDPLRHEWVSCKLLEAIVYLSHGKYEREKRTWSDEIWLKYLSEGHIEEEAVFLEIQKHPFEKLEKNLPPLAQIIIWIILGHHRLPNTEDWKSYEEKEQRNKQTMFDSIRATWGYANEGKKEKQEDCFTFSQGILADSDIWIKHVKKWSHRLLTFYQGHKEWIDKIRKEGEEEVDDSAERALRVVMMYSRLSVMLADHYISSQSKEKDRGCWKRPGLLANTTRKNHEGKQFLEEHLVKVSEQAVKIAHYLPRFMEQMEYAHDVKMLKQRSQAPFLWQNHVVEKIQQFRNKREEKDHAYFVINMASTGCGKTIANAKIVQALSKTGEELRYILAVGLRTLTLQTGDEYRKRIHLNENELAVLIGSKTITDLHEKDEQEKKGERNSGSDSEEDLLPEELSYIDTDGSLYQFMDIYFDTMSVGEEKSNKNKAFLYKPVLVTTIDHIMGATETIRGGRYILPMMRLMSSDIVIDEIDDFSGCDLMAISRLVHLAGMFGRNVILSSATIPPDLAEGMYHAYRAGLSCYNAFFSKKKQMSTVFCDEFRTEVVEPEQKQQEKYIDFHNRFIEKRVQSLKKQAPKRTGYIAACQISHQESERGNKYVQEIKHAIVTLHENHHIIDQKSGKHISFGVVRVANITPCVEISNALLALDWGKDKEIRLMTYHSRQVLLLRHEQEKYLDRILHRKGTGKTVDISDPIVRKHIDETKEKDLIFIVVATPIEEIGRDHDFDWAVIEPSSYRSIIQLAGRVSRHRPIIGEGPNIAIMQYNVRAIKNDAHPNKVSFAFPGYESRVHLLKSKDLMTLVNPDDMKERIDAIPRIQKRSPLHPEDKLIDLEHAVLMDFNNRTRKGPGTLHGWNDEYWWMTALPQKYNPFRAKTEEEYNCIYRYEKGQLTFGFYMKKEWISWSSHYSPIEIIEIDEKKQKRLWIERDYKTLLRCYGEREDIYDENLTEVSEKYGEIIIPVPNTSRDVKWQYHNQFGLWRP